MNACGLKERVPDTLRSDFNLRDRSASEWQGRLTMFHTLEFMVGTKFWLARIDSAFDVGRHGKCRPIPCRKGPGFKLCLGDPVWELVDVCRIRGFP